MDESFQLRARRLLGKREPARLDFQLLSATLSAQASASAAARAQARASTPSACPAPADPLGEIVLGGPERKEAASAQRGCFNRAEVRRRRNEP